MTRRLNMVGFSLTQMRKLLGSADEKTLQRLTDTVSNEVIDPNNAQELLAILSRAIRTGVPFHDLVQETSFHSSAANLLAADEQEWLTTMAYDWPASVFEEKLWPRYRKLATPETKAFLRGLVEGIPIFGQRSEPDGEGYAFVSLEKLRVFQPGLSDLRDQIMYRVGRKRKPSEDQLDAVRFATEICEWINQIVEARRDLYFLRW